VQDVSNFERFDMAKVAFTSGRVKGLKGLNALLISLKPFYGM
jgi:hypothetical protein